MPISKLLKHSLPEKWVVLRTREQQELCDLLTLRL